jgi:large subunit ribosomal protein L4
MIKYQVYNQQAQSVGEETLSEKVFGLTPNSALLHQVVIGSVANGRQVLAHTKGRADVRGGGKKPWRQKGTGRARAGSSRSPIWKGGGVTFGPTKDRNFSVKINDKMKHKALCIALSDKATDQNLVLVDDLKFDAFKTKAVNTMLEAFAKALWSADNGKRSVLVINHSRSEQLTYSARNLVGVKVINFDNLNLVDLLQYKKLIMPQAVAKILNERYGK